MQKLWISTSLLLLLAGLATADIVFLLDRDGKSNIYVMNDQGGNLRRLTADMPYKAIWPGLRMGTRLRFLQIPIWQNLGSRNRVKSLL